MRVSWPLLMAMQHHVVTISQDFLKANPFAGILAGHSLEVLDERILAISHLRIVLYVLSSYVPFNREAGIAPVEH